jgi:hypothetical protein
LSGCCHRVFLKVCKYGPVAGLLAGVSMAGSFPVINPEQFIPDER